jgi:hypothetical protein
MGTYRGDLFAFTVDVVAEILLHAAHCDNGVVAQSLYDLEGREKAVLVDAAKDYVQLVACFFENLGA